MIARATLILGTLMAAMLAGCAGTSTTRSAAAASSHGTLEARATNDGYGTDATPAGALACKTRDAFGVVTEVYLEGRGRTGTLRRITPSGMNEEESLRFERSGGALIGDRPTSDDLAVHAVTIREAEGKKYLRLGDRKQSWSACL